MTESAVATRPEAPAAALERVLLEGDLATLTVDQRLTYYNAVCESLGLNPLTKPFDYLKLSGKTVLYAKRDATDQLRKIHGVSVTSLIGVWHDDVYIVTAHVRDRQERSDVSTGAVPTANLRGEALANALMKAETKAKRRATLSICGLGLLDETEVGSIPGALVGEPEGRTFGTGEPPGPQKAVAAPSNSNEAPAAETSGDFVRWTANTLGCAPSEVAVQMKTMLGMPTTEFMTEPPGHTFGDLRRIVSAIQAARRNGHTHAIWDYCYVCGTRGVLIPGELEDQDTGEVGEAVCLDQAACVLALGQKEHPEHLTGSPK